MGGIDESLRLAPLRTGLLAREREVVAAFAADPEGPQVDVKAVRNFFHEKFSHERAAMAAGDLSGLSRLMGFHVWFPLQKEGRKHTYRFSWGPEAVVVWARSDGEQEVVVRVDAIVESRARPWSAIVHELGWRAWSTLTQYLVLVRCGDGWEIRDHVFDFDGQHYQSDELPWLPG